MTDKKGTYPGKNVEIFNRVAEKTGAALKIFLNSRILKKYQILADQASLHEGSMDGFLAGSSRDGFTVGSTDSFLHGYGSRYMNGSRAGSPMYSSRGGFISRCCQGSRNNSRDGLARGLNILIGYKFLAAFLSAFFPVFFMRNILFMVLLGAVSATTGFFLPDFVLNYISRRRIKEFNRDLPYIIDLLYIATLSGQNIYNSIKIVSEKYNGSICRALKKFLKEIDFGVSRTDAFNNTINLTDPGDFRNFLFLLIQAEKYGSSISDLLNQQSKYIRFEAIQKHEAASRRGSVILLFPLVFLILPAFILLVGGPLIFSIAGSYINFG